EPVAPNRLPEAPPPNAAPMSAPLPCWSSTRTITPSAVTTCAIIKRLFSQPIESSPCAGRGLPRPGLSGSGHRRRAADGQEIVGDERSTADQSAVHVRHREQAD